MANRCLGWQVNQTHWDYCLIKSQQQFYLRWECLNDRERKCLWAWTLLRRSRVEPRTALKALLLTERWGRVWRQLNNSELHKQLWVSIKPIFLSNRQINWAFIFMHYVPKNQQACCSTNYTKITTELWCGQTVIKFPRFANWINHRFIRVGSCTRARDVAAFSLIGYCLEVIDFWNFPESGWLMVEIRTRVAATTWPTLLNCFAFIKKIQQVNKFFPFLTLLFV